GDLAGRMRFPLRVIDAMRAEADGMALGVRMSVLEQVDDGLTEDLAVEALSEYAAHGIDFLNLNVGTISSDRELAEAIPGMGTPSAPWLETCRRIREAIDIPVLHAARISDAATARFAIEDGCLDLVGMTRAQLADPYLVRRSRRSARTTSAPAWARTCASIPSTPRERRPASTIPPAAGRPTCPRRSPTMPARAPSTSSSSVP